MSARQWKPGDVAMVECSDGEWRRAVCVLSPYGGPLAYEFEDAGRRRVDESHARPLVVIDPEDHEQVQHLVAAWFGETRGPYVSQMRAALRSLITDPKPDEPLGLGAVVEDADGATWVRVSTHLQNPWHGGGGRGGLNHHWDGVSAVRVLSEGVVTNA